MQASHCTQWARVLSWVRLSGFGVRCICILEIRWVDWRESFSIPIFLILLGTYETHRMDRCNDATHVFLERLYEPLLV